MDDVAKDVSILSNWTSVGEGSLSKTITYSSTEEKEYSLENVVADYCICLSQPEDEPATKPILEIKSEYALQQIDILSEGIFIEVFGDHGEYLCSCASEFIDSWKGMASYHTKIALPGVNKCELKFTRIADETRLWVYNIQLTVLHHVKSDEMFNFNNVNELLRNSDQKISKNAQNFKNLFEMYVKNKSQTDIQSSNLQAIRNLLFQNQFGLHANKTTLSKCFNELNLKEVLKNSASNPDQVIGNSKSDVLEQSIKQYVDMQLCKMKEDISKSVEMKLNKFQEDNQVKLDLIIQLLESLKSKLQCNHDKIMEKLSNMPNLC